ncbi:glycosyltransferase [Novosphingobium sp. LASN5T]|uniref:glycosyltransferase family 2 protein n=1 Tax=Novosphingobium sp. LASN5T TaxID=2491021 RepID=UPI001CC2133B|nr:glycosyltransferase family 2 protein [Novosphingobium sp. LASN5T]
MTGNRKSWSLWRNSGLLLRVHIDAARLAPRAWLQAAWWRLLGKKVRARARFAPLLSASRYAYQLWLLDEPPLPQGKGNACTVVALVSPGAGAEETMRSALAEGFIALHVQAEVSGACATQIDWSDDPWIMPLAAGDLLARGSGEVYRAFAASARKAGSRVVYADDDLIDSKGGRSNPHFKPRWNEELHRHFDFLTGACMVRLEAADLVGAGGEDWPSQLVARAVAAGQGDPVRIPHILHHRRSRPKPRRPLDVPVSRGDLPRVSVIVPTRNRLELLRTCIDGLEQTDYPDFEVIVVDNGSDDPAVLSYLARLDPSRYRVLRDSGPFNFSRLNNNAAQIATGELLCLLNNDIEMIGADWLAIMAWQALRKGVGAVGAMLLYPDGRLQHAGVVMNICGGAAHAHRLLWPGEAGYFHRHALPQFVSAVTAACLVVRRSSFEAVGGLDEQAFAVAFNDVDLCMRLNQRGWQSFYEPRAILVHHESISRGFDRDPVGAARLAGELAALQLRWRTNDLESEGDPYHHPHLSRYSERFAVQMPGDVR